MATNQPTLNEEAGLGPEWTPVDSSPIIPGMTPSAPQPTLASLGSNFIGSIPQGMQHDATLVRTGINSPNVPTFSLMPVAPSGNPATVSAVQSVTGGAAATADLDPFLHFRGTWTAFASYLINDVTIFNLSAYVAIKASSGISPETNNLVWALLSENLVFNPTINYTGGNPGFGAFDKFSSNSGATSPAVVTLTPANPHGYAIWLISSGGSGLASGFQDFGATFGMHALELQIAVTNASPITASSTIGTRWASEMVLFAGAGFSLTGTVTSASITSNVLTCQCIQNFAVGTRVDFPFGCFSGGLSFLNSSFVIITSVTPSSFTGNYTHADVASTSDTGTVVDSPYLQSVSFGNPTSAGVFTQTLPNPVKAGSTIAIFEATNDVNTQSVIISISDTVNGAGYTIKNEQNGSGTFCNIAWLQNVAAGSTTISVTLGTTTGSGTSTRLVAVELPGGGSALVPHYIPYDVLEFRGSFYVCLKDTSLDPLADPTSWGQLSQGTGGVDQLTGAYAAVAADYGRLKVNTTSSSYTVTLPNPALVSGPENNGTWWIAFQDVGSGSIVINPNGLNLDGSASSLTLNTGQGVLVFTDGTNYFTERGFGVPTTTGGVWNTTSKTTTYTAAVGDMVLATSTGGGFTITLPAASASLNRSIRVKKVSSDANVVTIAAAGADTIDGQATQSISIQYNEWEVISDGANWWAT